MLTFHFTGVDGYMAESEVLTSGMVGKDVRLEFSRDWDSLKKTVVFTAGMVTRDVMDVSEVVTIPAEVLATPMQQLYVGVYGISSSGSVTPTICVKGPRIEPGANPSGDPGASPDLPVWAQLKQEIEDLKNGTAGGDGATFIPSVSADGIISWTNDKGLTNPPPVNIMGPNGEPGSAGQDGTSVTVVSVSESTEDGGSNVVTFSDGTTLTVRNGQSASESAPDIPEYWQAALDTGAEAINTALCSAGRNKSAFLFYTDAHWDYGSQMSPMLLKYLYNHTGMTKTFFGGDIVNTEASDYNTMDYLWEWRKQLKGLPNHHSVPGNHDDGNATNNLFSEKYVYGYLLAPEETPDMVMGDGMYYYIDNPNEKTRYLCLDTGYMDLNSLSSGQMTFIKEALKSTPAGWNIVVVAHVWFAPDYDRYSERPVPIKGMSTTAASIATILSSYNYRDGEFADCGATVKFCIGGHIHYDYVGMATGGIPIICCETDSKHIRGTFAYKAGSTDESAVSGIIADYDDNTVTVVRVGRGNSFRVDLTTGEMTEITDGDNGDSGDSGDSGSTEQTYTNVLYDVGYQTGYRLNSSGGLTESSAECTTGFISAKTGDTLYFKNTEGKATSDSYCRIAMYDASQTFISGKSFVIPAGASYTTWYDDGNLESCYLNIDGVAWVRFSFMSIDDTSIITVNEPIVGNPANAPTPDTPTPETPTYTNVLDTVGYEVGRLDSSGLFKNDRTDRYTTGFISAKTGDTIYFKNIVSQTSDYGCQIAMYDASQTFISGKSYIIPDGASYATWDSDGNLSSCYLNIDNVEWVRFSFVTIDDTSIITVNTQIV